MDDFSFISPPFRSTKWRNQKPSLTLGVQHVHAHLCYDKNQLSPAELPAEEVKAVEFHVVSISKSQNI
jgi:hypothetical protein